MLRAKEARLYTRQIMCKNIKAIYQPIRPALLRMIDIRVYMVFELCSQACVQVQVTSAGMFREIVGHHILVLEYTKRAKVEVI